MEKCENCNKEIDGLYGSGRFCNVICARSFSTKKSRIEINLKISAKLKGRPPAHSLGFLSGYDPRRKIFSKQDRVKAVQVAKDRRLAFYSIASWEELPFTEQRRRVNFDQNGKCIRCGINEWLGSLLTLEFDHINGNHFDNRRENVRLLCPNCHSQTPTYCNRKREPENYS
jgi:hypothetical protein